MANYKVVDAEQLDADLKTVADSIRSKGGTTGKLEFPQGMKQAIESIQSGSGGNYEDILLLDVVQYYQAPVGEVASEVNAFGNEVISFVVVTDTHGTANKNNSQNIIRYLLKNTKANRLFWLGDVVKDNWLESDYKLYFEPFAKCIPQVFFALGNHELYNATMDDVTVIYDDLLADKNYLQGYPEKFYYYFDDTERKIRYLVINTSDGSHNYVSNEQISWIENSVQLPSSEWKIIAFGHMDIMPNDPITNEWNTHKETEITNALSSTNGTIIGYFCGHEHCDLMRQVNNKFYEIMLLNDSCSKDNTFEEITNPERVAGTISEQAVSVVSINTNAGDVTIRRIGAGENLSYNYLNDIETPDVTLSSISATYSGGDVAVGTSLNSLTGITVTAHYSDGSTSNVTEYTLSGTITEGSNTITVDYEGKTTTFTVTGVSSGTDTNVSGTTNWHDGVPYDIMNLKTDGIYIEKNGAETIYATWSATDYLYCFGAYKIKCSEKWFMNSSYCGCYDENKNYISNFGSDGNIEEFIIPDNVHYIRISALTENFAKVTVTPYATE